METTHNNIKLTSVEITGIWNSYIFETMVHHVFTYFLQHIEDPDIKSYVEQVQFLSKKNVNDYIAIFKKENFPIPRGTTSEDINLEAPRLFSDIFYISYIKSMAKFALMQFALSYSESSRSDIRKMFLDHLHILEEVDQTGTEIMLSKGIHIRPPSIPTPTEVKFVKHKNLFTGFFNSKRPLSILEISQLFYHSHSNALGKALMTGFIQVVKSKEIKQNFIKGKEMSHKYYKLFMELLVEEDITIPHSYDSEVSDCTESPFSDRLMLNHITFLNAYGLGTYGMALAQSFRSDLSAMYTRVMLEVGEYGKECANLLIKNEWMEEPPLAPDRQKLSKATKS